MQDPKQLLLNKTLDKVKKTIESLSIHSEKVTAQDLRKFCCQLTKDAELFAYLADFFELLSDDTSNSCEK